MNQAEKELIELFKSVIAKTLEQRGIKVVFPPDDLPIEAEELPAEVNDNKKPEEKAGPKTDTQTQKKK